MKTSLFAIALILSINTISAQTASVSPEELIKVEKSTNTPKSSVKTEKENTLTFHSLQQLNTSISKALQKNDLLRSNEISASLLLLIKIDETGKLHTYEVKNSNSKIMSNIVTDEVSKINGIQTVDLSIKGLTTIKIPIHYSI